MWIISAIFFGIISFVVPWANGYFSLITVLVPLLFNEGATFFAWYVYETYYKPANFKSFYLPSLLYIPLTFIYIILVEAVFNFSRFSEPGFIESHYQYHIFGDTFVFLLLFSTMWVVFQKWRVGKRTLISAYVMGAIFEAFFAGESGYGIAGILNGLLWVYLLHINWFFVVYLFRNSMEM